MIHYGTVGMEDAMCQTAQVILYSLALGVFSPGINVASATLHVFYDIQLFKHVYWVRSFISIIML